jgi:hypothetical protein
MRSGRDRSRAQRAIKSIDVAVFVGGLRKDSRNRKMA